MRRAKSLEQFRFLNSLKSCHTQSPVELPPGLSVTMSFHTEFHPIILAGGYGSRLGVLVEDPSIPKALLPVANRPLLSYQLELLEKVGFQCTYYIFFCAFYSECGP